MSTPAETLAAAMRVQSRDYTLWAFTLGIAIGLFVALVVFLAAIWWFA